MVLVVVCWLSWLTIRPNVFVFYLLQIAAVNGAGLGPSSEVHVTTDVKGMRKNNTWVNQLLYFIEVTVTLSSWWVYLAPPRPTRMPRAALNNAGVPIATSTTITIEMPECFFTDDHGPIQKVQVIVSEPAGIKICHLTIQHYGGEKIQFTIQQ